MRPAVEEQVEAVFGHTLFLDRPTPKRLAAWRHRAQQAAVNQAGYAFAPYEAVKRDGVVERLATTVAGLIGESSTRRRGTARALIQAALAAQPGRGGIPLLRAYDIGFRIRRLRLLARRLADMEAVSEDAALGPMHDAIFESLAGYLHCQRLEPLLTLRPLARSMGGDAMPLLDSIATAYDLAGLDAQADQRLSTALAALPRPLRRPLLLAYLGFPFYDTATLPLLGGEGMDEFDAIKVDRIAPEDAATIRAGGAEATLKGIQFNSFGAFFSRAYRENDYLWGRLHGAERMIDIIVSTLPMGSRLRAGRLSAIKRAAFLAILDEEEPRLATAAALIAQIRREIG
jgi:hypothetical protein